MTLIIASSHWNGICFNTDTRVTNLTSKCYKDNAQKFAHIHGGIGMIASGDRLSAIIVREVVRKHLDKFSQTNIKFPPTVDLQNVFQSLFIQSLKELREHPLNKQRPIYDVSSTGFFGVNINDQPLTLNQEESNNLIKIIVEGKKINSLYSKYIEKIGLCANGQIPKAILKDHHQNTLFRYRVKLFDNIEEDIYEVKKVPFGKIIVLGSGSEFNYESIESKVLSFVLFDNTSDDIGNGAFHLGMIHHYAEKEVGIDKRFNFKTFGGAIIAGTIETDENGMGSTKIFLGKTGDKKTGSIISEVLEINKELWVITKEGKKVKLEQFPDKLIYSEKLLW